MKKLVLILLVAAICLTLAGCKSKEVSAVEEKITAIGIVTVDSGSAITAAEDAYKALSESDAGTVENYAVLQEARKTYDNMTKAAEVEKAIADAVANLTPDSEGAVAAAKSKYESASAEVKALVKNFGEIAAAEDKMSQLRADVVIEQIKALGAITVDSKDAIDAAEAAYNALADGDKGKVTNFGDIEAARGKYLEARAQVAIDAINAIGAVTIDSKEAINAAEEAYKALTAEEKEKVTNYDALTAAKEALKAIKAEEGGKVLAEMRVEEDRIRGLSFYYPSAWKFYNNGNWAADKRCFILPYLGTDAKGNAWLRLVYNYTARDWVFYTSVIVSADGSNTTKIFKYSDVVRDNGGGKVWEYIDTEVGDREVEMLWAIANSTETLVRFQGRDYSFDYTVTQEEKDSIRTALTAYELLS